MSVATLAGNKVTSARANIPAWGAWYADASVDKEVTLSGAVTLKIADLTLSGTVLSGGPEKGRSHFRIVGGKGGWGKTVPKKSYGNDAGVKASTVLSDAAREAGETIDAATLPTDRIGPAFVRPSGPACRVLEIVAPSNWYVSEDGTTRIGKRAVTPYKGKAAHGLVDKARGTVTLAADDIATILPGITVDGLEAIDVLHELSPKGGLRSTVWGKHGPRTSRRLEAMRALLEQLDPDRAFRSIWEYRVVTIEGERLNLQPVRVSTGMPDLPRVPVYPGVSGCKSIVSLGSRVLVGFVDASPGRPFVVAFEDPEGEGFKPVTLSIDALTSVSIAGGVLPTARMGDLAGGIWPVAATAVKVLT